MNQKTATRLLEANGWSGDPQAGRHKMTAERSGAPMELTAHVHLEDGSYWAEVEELPGCFASGETLDELMAGLSEAIALCLESGERGGSGATPERPLHLQTAVLNDRPG